MKNITLIPAILLSLTSITALANGYTCKYVKATIQGPLTPDPACNIQLEKQNHFPDLTFLASLGVPPQYACFSGSLNGILSDTPTGTGAPITGTFYAGLTANGISNTQLTAASAIRLYAGNIELGRVFTKDVIFDGYDEELLTMVDGSKRYNGGFGTMEITGDALSGPTTLTGKLCTQD